MDTISLTYDEIAERLRISGASARNLVRRKRWSRTTGNDGKARIAVPLDAIEGAASVPAEVPPAGASEVPTDGAMALQLARLEVQVSGLREIVDAERARAAAAEADRDAWRSLALRPWWKRLAG